jgi:ABC-type amino acid transport substrate-binding protein
MNKIALIFLILYNLFSQSIDVLIRENSDKFVEFEKDMVENVFKLHNERTKSNFKLNFIPSKFADIMEKLKNPSNINMLGMHAISITEDRKKTYDFSMPYMVNRLVISKSRINRPVLKVTDSLAIFGLLRGSIYEELMKIRSKKFKQKYKLYESSPSIYSDLLAGNIHYYLSDYSRLWVYDLEAAEEIKLMKDDQNALLYVKNSPLKKKLDETLEKFLRSENFYNIVKKHFGQDAVTFFQLGLKKRQ